MIVKVPVLIFFFEFDEKRMRVVEKHRTREMWVDAADLAKVKSVSDVNTTVLPKALGGNWKVDLDVTCDVTSRRFRLYGCWSCTPGALTMEKMVLIKLPEEKKAPSEGATDE